jgi:hypothetical protein
MKMQEHARENQMHTLTPPGVPSTSTWGSIYRREQGPQSRGHLGLRREVELSLAFAVG